jgi:thioesterase domain-containing protein/acyl carrier protein
MPKASSKVVPQTTEPSAADIRDWVVTEVAKLVELERSSIDSNAPLYSFAVDSLKALGLAGALAGWLDRELPATLLWDYPTIDAIAEALTNPEVAAVATARPGVIDLQPQGHVLPLFCFPGARGHPVTFAPMAMCLAPDYPCYGLTVPGFNGEQAPLEKIEDIAAAMLENLRRVQPRGPYQLAGYSYGGLPAFEAAQQLTAAGETVSLLAMFDTSTPDGFAIRPRWQRAAYHAWILAAHPGRRKYIRERLAHRQQLRSAELHLPAMAEIHELPKEEAFAREVEAANNRAIARYQPTPYGGSILIFRAIDRQTYRVAYRYDTVITGWAALTDGRCHVIDLPGDHMNVLSVENAPIAAKKLKPHLSASLAL